jgi:hypothetical protein
MMIKNHIYIIKLKAKKIIQIIRNNKILLMNNHP